MCRREAGEREKRKRLGSLGIIGNCLRTMGRGKNGKGKFPIVHRPIFMGQTLKLLANGRNNIVSAYTGLKV